MTPEKGGESRKVWTGTATRTTSTSRSPSALVVARECGPFGWPLYSFMTILYNGFLACGVELCVLEDNKPIKAKKRILVWNMLLAIYTIFPHCYFSTWALSLSVVEKRFG
jgi:hypothetical protein